MSFLKHFVNLLHGADRPLEKPVVLQFPVIDICNSACQMCHIWKNKKRETVTPEQLRIALRNPLFSEVTSVGLNGGEPTLRKDLALLTEGLFDSLPKLRNISLITNAYKVDWAIARIGETAEVVRRRGGKIDVMVSLDGVGEVHDAVRGKPGNFARAVEVIEYLKNEERIDTIRIGCTIIRDNVYGLHALFDFCEREGLYVKYRMGIPHKRLYTHDIEEPFELDNTEIVHVATFLEGLIKHYESNAKQRQFYKSLIRQLVDGAPRKAGCDWRHRGATINSDGEVMYCAVESPVVTTLDATDLETSYFQAEDKLDLIKRDKCATCLHDYVGLPDRREQLKILAEEVRSKIGARKIPGLDASRKSVGGVRSKFRFNQQIKRLAAIAPENGIQGDDRRMILVCGWYGTETLGDKAILGAVVAGLKRACPSAKIGLVSLHPEISRLTRAQMPELMDVAILTVDQGLAAASKSLAIVFGGGPLMGISELLSMRRLFELGRLGGARTIIAGCGVGPLGPTRFHPVIADILRLSDRRIFRDKASRARAVALGIAAEGDAVTEDPAASWIRSHRSKAARRTDSLLLGLREFPYNDYAPELGEAEAKRLMENSDRSMLESLRELVKQRPDLTIRPVPMCANHYGGDDRWYYRRLFAAAPELRSKIDWSLLGLERTPQEYLRVFEEASVAVAMRFHSLVFAQACGTPTLAIDYTMGRGKVSSLAEATSTPSLVYGAFDSGLLLRSLEGLFEKHVEYPRVTSAPFEEVFVAEVASLLKVAEPIGA